MRSTMPHMPELQDASAFRYQVLDHVSLHALHGDDLVQNYSPDVYKCLPVLTARSRSDVRRSTSAEAGMRRAGK